MVGGEGEGEGEGESEGEAPCSAGQGDNVAEGEVIITNPQELGALAGCREITGALALANQEPLSRLAGLESLTSVGCELFVDGNAASPQCQADALASRPGKACSCEGNDDTTSCD